MPLRGVIGTDYLKVRPDFQVMRNPYGDDDIVIVPAITPDIGLFHAFRADTDGNVIADRGQDCLLLAQAARRVIVTVEELVPPGDLVRNSFDTAIPAIYVDAVVHAPHGAHPTTCLGYYRRDGRHIREYQQQASIGDAEFQHYLDHYVRLGEERYLELVGVIAGKGEGR